jgi:IS30 family transposase
VKFRLLEGGLSVDSDAQAMDNLIDRMNALAKIIDLFNQSDWQPSEVAMWLQYEKDLALVETKLYIEQKEQQ